MTASPPLAEAGTLSRHSQSSTATAWDDTGVDFSMDLHVFRLHHRLMPPFSLSITSSPGFECSVTAPAVPADAACTRLAPAALNHRLKWLRPRALS